MCASLPCGLQHAAARSQAAQPIRAVSERCVLANAKQAYAPMSQWPDAATIDQQEREGSDEHIENELLFATPILSGAQVRVLLDVCTSPHGLF